MLIRFAVLIFISMLAVTSKAQDDIYTFDTDNQRQSYKTLSVELRCPKCQNQNLADSNSEIAEIMRDIIAEELVAGKTEDEIKTMMVDRYGDFVLYKPPVNIETMLLWWAPVIFILVVIIVFVITVKKRSRYAFDEEPEDEIYEEAQASQNSVTNNADEYSKAQPNKAQEPRDN